MSSLPTLDATTPALTSIMAIRRSGATKDESVLLSQVKDLIAPTANQVAATGAGTAYALTTTSALIDLGTTDPTIVLDEAGVYLLCADVVINYNAATFAASQDVIIKLRKTNNTPADIAGGSRTIKTDIVTTKTATMQAFGFISEPFSTNNTDDTISLFGSVAAAPGAGSLDVTFANIRAFRLQQ